MKVLIRTRVVPCSSLISDPVVIDVLDAERVVGVEYQAPVAQGRTGYTQACLVVYTVTEERPA